MDGSTEDGLPKEVAEVSTQNSSALSPRLPRLLLPSSKPDKTSAGTSSASNPPKVKQTDKQTNWSQYHRGCRKNHSMFMDWGNVDPVGKSRGYVPKRGKTKSLSSYKDIEKQDIAGYLKKNKQFLEAYVTENIPPGELKKWLDKAKKKNNTIPSKSDKQLVSFSNEVKLSNKQMFSELLKVLQDDPNERAVVGELAKYMASSVGVDAYQVYKLFPDHPNYVEFVEPLDGEAGRLFRAEPEQVGRILEVAKTGTCCRLSRVDDPTCFPETSVSLFKSLKKDVEQADHVMYQTILAKNEKTAYIIEMWRVNERFKDIDEQISSNFVVLGSLALHSCNMYLDKNRERNLTDFLLAVVKAIFEEMVSLNQLIEKILEFAQRLVNADRASLFLVDYRNSELVSTVFDLRFEPGHDRDMLKNEIRMPINRGIAGYVAMSGETMNIPDAYSDHRFNREVDEATGYQTVSILCMPVKVEGHVIAVVQMVNKRDGFNFGHEDEAAFGVFSTFFGLALHNARLYDRIMRKEQKYRVALEVLSYHNTCREKEVLYLLNYKDPVNLNLNDFYLDPYKFDEFEKCKCFIKMFGELFDMINFDIITLTRFLLTVRKNYRTVPYHNFDHGWTVAHSMYVILKNDQENYFNYKMRLAMFVASLCHDLDHRGYTNKYMSEIASPLAAMYTTSTLEHHHFNITITILQQEGHNIFANVWNDAYKEILGYIKQCILATDLAAFFPNMAKIQKLHEGHPEFNWNVREHQELAMAISMTAADLSASAKPWSIQYKTVKVIFEEFYDQGDKERAAGREPIPMMDRNKPHQQPSSQVGFLSQICAPCYDMLFRLLPNTKPMYTKVMQNLDRWKAKADLIERRKLNMVVTRDEDLEVIDLEQDMAVLEVRDDPVPDDEAAFTRTLREPKTC